MNVIKGPHHYFEIAGMLYSLALNNVSTLNGNGIDRLSHIAMFNNISHVYKTLQGYDSYDAYLYDILLLKAIYWLKDSSDSNYLDHSASYSLDSNSYELSSRTLSSSSDVTTQTMTTTTTTATTAGAGATFATDNEEIIDTFFDNVFYLISASNPPASAA